MKEIRLTSENMPVSWRLGKPAEAPSEEVLQRASERLAEGLREDAIELRRRITTPSGKRYKQQAL